MEVGNVLTNEHVEAPQSHICVGSVHRLSRLIPFLMLLRIVHERIFWLKDIFDLAGNFNLEIYYKFPFNN